MQINIIETIKQILLDGRRASAEELQHEWETIKKFKTKLEDKNND